MKEAGRNDWKAYLESRPVVAEIVLRMRSSRLQRPQDAKHISVTCLIRRLRRRSKQRRMKGMISRQKTCTHYLTFTDEDVIKNGPLLNVRRSCSQRSG